MHRRRLLVLTLGLSLAVSVVAGLAAVGLAEGPTPQGADPGQHAEGAGQAPPAGASGRDLVIPDAPQASVSPWSSIMAVSSAVAGGVFVLAGVALRREVGDEKRRMRAQRLRRSLVEDQRDYARFRDGPPRDNN